MKNDFDIVAIGDTVIDAFIRLKGAEVIGEPDTTGYKICLPFADKVPYEEVSVVPAVGNAANGAVSASRLGLRTAIVTNLGNDQEGKNCLEAFKENNIDTRFVKVHENIKTNYHYVLWYESERTILIKHEIFPYSLPDIGNPSWVYFSSVNETAFPFHNTVVDYLETHPEIKFAFQPGKFEIKLGREKLSRLYQRANIFFCNVEEAEKILGIEDQNSLSDKKELLKKMHELGPKIVVITDGPGGSYAYDGVDFWFMPLYPDQNPPLERTGAGDAFSSTIVAALSLGKTLSEALEWAGINAMSVVQGVGAQKGLLSKDKLEEYLRVAPENYQARKI